MLLLLGSKADSVKGLFSKEDFLAGLTSFAAELPDLKYDAPKCDEWLSSLFGVLIAKGLIDGASVKKALKPVLDDPFNGQMVGAFAYHITKCISDNVESDATKFLDGKGLRILYRRGLSWAFKMYKMSAAERFLDNSKVLLKDLAPALWLSIEFFEHKVKKKEDVGSLKSWLEQNLQHLKSGGDMDDELQDLSYGFTAVIVSNLGRKVDDLSELINYVDILKMIVTSEESASVNGCTDAIQAFSGANNWKAKDEDVVLDKLVEVGVLPKTSVDFLKQWRE